MNTDLKEPRLCNVCAAYKNYALTSAISSFDFLGYQTFAGYQSFTEILVNRCIF